MRNAYKLYARRDYSLDSGLGDTHFDHDTGDLDYPAVIPPADIDPIKVQFVGEPELILQRDGLGYLVYIRHDLMRYGVDGYGKRVYSKWRAGRYGRRLLSQYNKERA